MVGVIAVAKSLQQDDAMIRAMVVLEFFVVATFTSEAVKRCTRTFEPREPGGAVASRKSVRGTFLRAV